MVNLTNIKQESRLKVIYTSPSPVYMFESKQNEYGGSYTGDTI